MVFIQGGNRADDLEYGWLLLFWLLILARCSPLGFHKVAVANCGTPLTEPYFPLGVYNDKLPLRISINLSRCIVLSKPPPDTFESFVQTSKYHSQNTSL